MNIWATRIKVLVLSGVFASFANAISTFKTGVYVSPLESLPGIALMIAMVLFALGLQQVIEKVCKIHLPSIVYISLTSVVASIPGFSPISELVLTEFNKVGLLPLCTPILAYAGIAIGKDLEDFKKQGVAIVCVAVFTFLGTFVGSAVIAQLVLRATGVI